ncbi:MAG: hypothetical protein H6943_00385 [Zoogloeaceae bacterium]|nr:hypothetical protein [Zoogloeaceae bacterium]
MTTVRLNASPQFAADGPTRKPVSLRDIVTPVAGTDGVDADRRRTLREELTAAEERFPVGSTSDAAADAQSVVEELTRLGSEAMHALRTPSRKAMHLVNNVAGDNYVDEQA